MFAPEGLGALSTFLVYNGLYGELSERTMQWPNLGVKKSGRQGWVVDSAPTDLQICSKSGVISTPLPIKLLSLASQSRHLD